MRRSPCIPLAGVTLSLLFAVSSPADTLTLYPGGDTSIREASPNQTFGAVPMEVRGGASPSRALIRFNLTDLRFMLGGGGVLHSATLRVHLDDSSGWPTEGAAIELHRIETDWAAIWATWNCPSDSNRTNDLPDCPQPWSGGTVRPEVAASRSIMGGETGWIEIDVTDDLADLTEPGARYGWLLRVGDETIDALAFFGVSETGYAPRLVIDYTPPFNVDDAFAQAVRFEPSPSDPQVVHGLDSRDRLVWRHGPEGTQGYRYDELANELAEYVDELGNRTWFLRDGNGALMERRHHYRNAGDWSERSFHDNEGQLVVEALEWSEEALNHKLALLGLTPGVPPGPMTQTWSEDEVGTTNELANGFSRVVLWTSKSLTHSLGEVYHRETSESLGKRMVVSVEDNEQGTLVRDDWGGWQLHRSDELDLVSVEDEHGYVLSIERDEVGRPVELWVGEHVKVLYAWDVDNRVTKRIVDLRTGEVVMTVNPAIPVGHYHQPQIQTTTQPRRSTAALLPDLGRVVEWDAVYPWDGHALATLHGEPYALIPLDGSHPPWRSVTPFRVGFMNDRVDYSADEVVVHLETDAGGSDNRRHTYAIILPRRELPEQMAGAAVAPENRLAWPGAAEDGLRQRTGRAISMCGAANSCLCISTVKYDKKSGTSHEHLSVRCPSPTGGGGGGGGPRAPAPPPQPKAPSGGPLQPNQKLSLNRAKDIANRAMRSREQCRNLFKGLNNENWDHVMNDWNEWRNGEGVRQPGATRVPCGENISAWTITNRPTIYMCDRFTALTPNQAAVILIHEALHTAGLPENPPTTKAKTSEEINQMVRDACFADKTQ